MPYGLSEKEFKQVSVKKDRTGEFIAFLRSLTHSTDQLVKKNIESMDRMLAKVQSLVQAKPEVNVSVNQQEVVDCVNKSTAAILKSNAELTEVLSRKKTYEFYVTYDNADMITKVVAKEK